MSLGQKFIVSTTALLLLSACSKEKGKGSSGNARLTLENQGTSLAAADIQSNTPNYFGVKLIAVSLQTDDDVSSTGHGSSIYLNPACGDATLKSTIDDKEYTYVGIPSCSTDQIPEFFNLARSSDEVNAELNSQALPVLPGTYKFVRVSLCQGTPTVPNVRFGLEALDSTLEIIYPGCSVSSIEMDPPLVVNSGDNIVVNLAYDLEGIITSSEGASGSHCEAGSDGLTHCVSFPDLAPSAAAATN